MTDIANAARFSGRVEAYERFRTRFPSSILDRLTRACGLLPSHVVADIGAGTGMLAELFLAHGNPVIAVEPNPEMRAGCDRLRARYPGLDVLGASAEETTIAPASVDFVAVGRAFHWFDRPRAIAEFARILRPGGWVVLVTSQWGGDGSPTARQFEDILKTHGIDYHKVLDARLTEAELSHLFDPSTLLDEEIHGEQQVTLAELLGRSESLSVTPLPGHPRYQPFRDAIQEYFRTHANGEFVRTVVSYRLICGRISEPGKHVSL